ncbi:hypothetical protein L218DRAFT_617762 [Marasmius fiardii PR-910]|nr:hypothetical protein L218DRAFT_617762 [Marasmius fiardii PR-910]
MDFHRYPSAVEIALSQRPLVLRILPTFPFLVLCMFVRLKCIEFIRAYNSHTLLIGPMEENVGGECTKRKVVNEIEEGRTMSTKGRRKMTCDRYPPTFLFDEPSRSF